VPRARLLSPSLFLRRSAIYKGLLGGSRGWLVVGGIAWVARFVKRALRGEEVVAARERLDPGQVMRLEVVAPPTRRERRALRRANAAG